MNGDSLNEDRGRGEGVDVDDGCPVESVHIRRLKERLLDREVDEDKYPVMFRAVLDAGVAAAVQYAVGKSC
jgi:hypothetical protein